MGASSIKIIIIIIIINRTVYNSNTPPAVCLFKKVFFVCIFKDMDREFRKLMRWFGKTHKPYKVIIKVYIVHVQCSLMF